MSAVNASRSATTPLVWQECVLRFPLVTTRWSSAMAVLCDSGDIELMPPRGFGAVLIDARPQGDDRAEITIHVEQPDGAVRVATSVSAQVSVTRDEHGMVHLDFIDSSAEDSVVMSVSLDAATPHALHYARTSLLRRIDLAAGATDAPVLESFVGSSSVDV